MQTLRKCGALVLTFCMIFSLLPAAQAQEVTTVVFSGVVQAATGEPISNVTVSCAGGSTRTDGQGNWSMSLPGQTSYSFSFSKEGYQFSGGLAVTHTTGSALDCGTVYGRPEPSAEPVKKEEPKTEPAADPKPASDPIKKEDPKPKPDNTEKKEETKTETNDNTQSSGSDNTEKKEEPKTETNNSAQSSGGSDNTEKKDEPKAETNDNAQPSGSDNTEKKEEPKTETNDNAQTSGSDNTEKKDEPKAETNDDAQTSGSDKTEKKDEPKTETNDNTQSSGSDNAEKKEEPKAETNDNTQTSGNSDNTEKKEEPQTETGDLTSPTAEPTPTATPVSQGSDVQSEQQGTGSRLASFFDALTKRSDTTQTDQTDENPSIDSKTEQTDSSTTVVQQLNAPIFANAPSNVLAQSQTISWQAVEGATAYSVAFTDMTNGAVSIFTKTIEETSITVTDLENGHLYSLTVQAIADGRTASNEARCSFTCVLVNEGDLNLNQEEENKTEEKQNNEDGAPIIMLASVIMPFFTAPDATVTTPSITFNWEPVEGAAYYRFSLRSKVGNTILVQDTQVNGLTYTYNGAGTMTANNSYIATVAAVYNNGRLSDRATCEFLYNPAGQGRVPLDTPVITAPSTNVTGLPFTITWNPVAGAAGYQISVYSAQTQTNVINTRTLPANTTQFTVDASLAQAFVNGRNYQIHVRAIPADGSLTHLESAWATQSFTYATASKLATPTITYPTNGASIIPGVNYTVTFTWQSVAGAARYSLYLNNQLLNDRAQGNSYTASNLQPGNYTLTVQAHKTNASHVDDSALASVSFTVVHPANPAITTLSASPNAISQGQGFTLYFDAINAAATDTVTLVGTNLATSLGNLQRMGTRYAWSIPANTFAAGVHTLQLTISNGVTYSTSVSTTLTVLSGSLANPVIDPIPDQRAGTPISVSWSAVEGAARYDVTLRLNNSVVWTGSSTQPLITIPASHTGTAGAYSLTVQALPPNGAQTAHGVGTIYFNIVTSTAYPWSGWVQGYSTPLYRDAASHYVIGNITWDQPVWVVGESGMYYQVSVGGHYGYSGYVLKHMIGVNPWSPCRDGHHQYVSKYESAHPHRQYIACQLCGAWSYTGQVMTTSPSSQCCYCGNHAWGTTVADKKHPHSTGTVTCTRCAAQKTVTLSGYKLKGCSKCYPSSGSSGTHATPTPSPTPSVRYDSLGNRLYDTTDFRSTFGSTAERNNTYSYIAGLYDQLRKQADEASDNGIAQTPLRVLLAYTFMPFDEEWHSAQYGQARITLTQDNGVAFLAVLAAEACASQEIVGAPDGLQKAATQMGQVLSELLALDDMLDLEARAFLTTLQKQCETVAASTPGISLTGTNDHNVRYVLTELLKGIPYDEKIIDETLSALAQTLGEPTTVRALNIVYAHADYRHTVFTSLLASLPVYATNVQLDELMEAYDNYLIALSQLHTFAEQVTGAEKGTYNSYWTTELRRRNNVMRIYETMFDAG